MTTVSAVCTRVRIATAASVIAAAAILLPAVASASPVAPLPAAGLGSTLSGGTVAPCAPQDAVCNAAQINTPSLAPNKNAAAVTQNPIFWFGPANPNFKPLVGIIFPDFGLNFEACFLGAAIHLSPYGTGFIGLGLGC